jgi:hypothetical protein
MLNPIIFTAENAEVAEAFSVLSAFSAVFV